MFSMNSNAAHSNKITPAKQRIGSIFIFFPISIFFSVEQRNCITKTIPKDLCY